MYSAFMASESVQVPELEKVNQPIRKCHMICRLMTGVFNPNELENVTASGQAPRAVPTEQKKEKYELLHLDSKQIIIGT